MMRRKFALAVGGSAFVLLLAALVLGAVNGNVARVVGAGFFLAFPVIGLVITRARPGNPVAWCFLIAALFIGVEGAGTEASILGQRRHWPEGAVHVAAWAPAWAWFPGIFLLLTVALLRFPDGRLVGSRWRWVERVSYAAMFVWTLSIGVVAALIPARELLSNAVPDPQGWKKVVFLVGEAMFFVVFVCVLASLASLIVRYRRGGTVEREQTRWVLSAAAVAIMIELVLDTSSSFVGSVPDWLQTIGEGGGITLIAIATGVAITRYKLYEIERIVSRTVAYAVVLVALAALYVGLLLGLAALVPHDLGQVGVAVATLVVSIVAVPLTRRVRLAVDRRFNRSRIDAEQVVTAFATQLRARPDQGDVPADLIAVLERTVQPSHAGIWIVPISS